MAINNKIQLPVAASHSSKLDISSTHITTGSFMQFRPLYYRHTIPGEHIKGSCNVLSRLAPLQVPTYGRCRINIRGWFVPFRLVFPNFDSFLTDSIASNYNNSSLVGSSPIFANNAILEMFVTDSYLGHALSTELTTWSSGDPYDFYSGTKHYAFTYYGLCFYTILTSLGYRMCLGDLKSNDFNYSALGLLCLARVYADWYTNDQYRNSSDFLYLMRLFKFNDPTSNLVLTHSDLCSILSFLLCVIYDGGRDVFVNAWDNPVSPNSGNLSPIVGQDITELSQGNSMNGLSSVYVTTSNLSNNTPIMEQVSDQNTGIGSQYIHDYLKAVTDFVKRNQLSGAAECDRFLSRFGINLDSSKLDRSVYVCEKSIDIDFASVMSQANTATAGNPSNLGDYAGQGLGRGNLEFDYKCNDFGLFLLTYSIIPTASLYQGYDRNNLHIGKMDFFQPEFDQLGCSAISKGEVYVSPNDTFAVYNSAYQQIFGFAPRHYEYKQKQDFVTGEFVSPTAFIGGDAWHLNRELDDGTFGGSIANVVHSLGFTRGLDSGIYDRIFQYTNPDKDKFYLVFHVAAETIAPCKSLSDTYDFESNAKKITLHSNGAKVN